MTRRLSVAFLVVAFCASAFAADEPHDRVRAALRALSDDDAPRAVEILTAVAAETPGDATVQLGLGVALSRVGRREDARAAYERALAAPEGGEVADRALFNLGASHLADAFAVAETLRDPERSANVEPQARMATAQKGIESARAAIRALRDRVRSAPDDREAAHNLQVAQRTRRFLEEELQRQQEESGESGEPGEPGEDGEDGEKKESEPKDGEQSDSGDDAQQSPDQNDGEQDGEQPDSPESGNQGDEQDGDEQKPSGTQDGDEDGDENQPPPEQGAAGKGEEPKEDDPLRDLLEAAARRLRLVEEMRKSKMRPVRVEKDW